MSAASGIRTSPRGAVDDQPAAASVPSTLLTSPTLSSFVVDHDAADQVVPVERLVRQRRQPLDRHPQLAPRERSSASFIVSTPSTPMTGRSCWNRTVVIRNRLRNPAALDEQLGARLKPLVGKSVSGFTIT